MLPGAHCQEYFVRKASGSHEASTHLLCQDPDGNKYKAAMKWNIPVVSREWLFACAANDALVPIDKYPVGCDEKIVMDAHPLENQRMNKSSTKEEPQNVNLRSADEEIPMETNDAASAIQAVNVNKATGSHGSTQKQPVKRTSIYNRPFRPSFDLTDVMAELASPAFPSLRSRKSRGSRNSFPLDDFFAENIKQTLQKLGAVAPPTRQGDDEDDNEDETTDDVHQEEEVHL